MPSKKYDKPKELYVSLRDIERQFNWLADWNGFLWYIADHARIIKIDDRACTLELVSRIHEYHVMTAIRNYVPKPLKKEIEQSLKSGMVHKLAEANRNKAIVVQTFFRGIQKFQWFTEIFPDSSMAPDVFDDSWILEIFLSKLKEFPSRTEIEEEYPQSFTLPECTINSAGRVGEYPCCFPIAKGRILLPNHVVLLFQTKKSKENLIIRLVKLICINDSVIWCATYKALWTDGCCQLIFADDYTFRKYCADNAIKVPQYEYSTKAMLVNENYVDSKLHGTCRELEIFCETMKSISNQQGNKRAEGAREEDKSWYVRGHWRIYKSGKKVFVHPYVKGANNQHKQSRRDRAEE